MAISFFDIRSGLLHQKYVKIAFEKGSNSKIKFSLELEGFIFPQNQSDSSIIHNSSLLFGIIRFYHKLEPSNTKENNHLRAIRMSNSIEIGQVPSNSKRRLEIWKQKVLSETRFYFISPMFHHFPPIFGRGIRCYAPRNLTKFQDHWIYRSS